MVSPVPRQAEGPEQGHSLTKAVGTGKDEGGAPKHLKKHDEKEDEKAIAKGFAFHPGGHVALAGEAEAPSDEAEELSASAITVAIRLAAFGDGDDEGNEEAEQPEPGKENVEEAQHQIGEGDDPHVVVPVLGHAHTSFILMTDAGHSRAQSPQPTQRVVSILATMPRHT